MRVFRRVLIGCAVAVAWPLVASAAPDLRVCVAETNLPYSERSSDSGFDVEVARAVAAILGRAYVPVWNANATSIVEIDDSDYPIQRLARGACDAIFSVPGPATDSLGGDDSLALGQPYYGAAFELFACAAEPDPDLRALSGKKVAIQSQTVAHFALLAVNAEPQSTFSVAAALDSVRSGQAQAGLLWGPSAGSLLANRAAPAVSGGGDATPACGLVAAYEPPAALRWNLHVATRKQDRPLRDDIDTALAELAAAGTLDQLQNRFGVPLHSPFSSTYTRGAVDDLRDSP